MPDDKQLEEMILQKVVRANATLWGLVAGLLAGVVLFLATNILILKGGDVVGPNLQLLGQFFWGYRVTFLGSLIGFIWAFATCFVAAYLVAHVYNRIAERRS